jgi:hypothetical protein
VASWLASTHRVSYGAARRTAATARALEHMPATAGTGAGRRLPGRSRGAG